MEYVKEDYLLGNKKIIVGDRLHDLVLENLGKIYIRYGSSYKEFNSIISSISKATGTAIIKIEEGNLSDASVYGNGTLVYHVKSDTLYLVYNDEFLTLAEAVTTTSDKYVRKTGDTMTGPLTITCDGPPLIVLSSDLVQNFNANYLEGHRASEFAIKYQDETITGNWTFEGETTFDNRTNFNKTATYNATDGSAAIRIGTGDLITDGSIGSSQYSSGMTGYGWRLDANTNTLEIDNLIVRGVMHVFALVVNKVSATNGSMWITDSFEIKTVHDLEYLEIKNGTLNTDISLLSTEKYYVPYTYNPTSTVYEESDDFKETIFPATKAYNYYLVGIKDSSLPIRDGSNVNDLVIKFFRFHFLFKILDKGAFLDAIRGHYASVIEHYETYITFHYDEHGYLRDASDNYYTLNYNSNSDTYTLSISTSDEDRARQTNVEAAIYDRGTPHLNYLSDYDQMTELARQGIIEKINLYQKYPESMDDYEYVADGDGTTSRQSVYIDPTFDKHYFSVVPAKEVVLHDDYGYYSLNNTIYKMNLYYKYFGEKLPESGLFPEDKSLYIVEAEKGEYPVFHAGDILKCQKFTGTSVKQYHAVVLGNVGSYGFVIQIQKDSILNRNMKYSYDDEGNLTGYTNSSEAQLDTTLYTRSGDIDKRVSADGETASEALLEEEIKSCPQEKDALVRIGSIVDESRRDSMLLTSSESYSPFTDVIVGVNRPDYSVLYFTPKYKMFKKYFVVNGINTERTFYIQNELFGAIMDLATKLNSGTSWGNKSLDTIKEKIAEGLTYSTWESDYLPIYEKYKDISTSCLIPNVDTKNTNAITKQAKVRLTYQENSDDPNYYDANGDRIKVTIEEPYVDYAGKEQVEKVKYYTSPVTTRTIVTPYVSGTKDSKDFKSDDSTNFVTLTIGKLIQ